MAVAEASPRVARRPRIEELAACLADEARLYADLLALGERERAAVAAQDPAILHAIVADKETLIASIARVEASRLGWLAAFAQANGSSEAESSLTALLRSLPADEAAAIAPLRDLLLARIRDVAQMNHQNGQLMQSVLRIVNGSLEALNRVRGEGVYRPTGHAARAGGNTVLDFRV